MDKILIFTATYNEAENISQLIDKIYSTNSNVDLLIVDDNSPDETSTIVNQIIKNNSQIKLITREKKLGLNTAHIMGYEYALKNDYTKLITLDADLSHDPSKINTFIKLLDTYPFVIGSRYMKDGKCEMNIFRYLLSYFGNKLIKFVFKVDLNEFTTSYRGFNLNSIKPFHLNQTTSKGYSFFMETIYLLKKHKIEMLEIPIIFESRKKGYSKIPNLEIFRTLSNLFLIIFKK